MKTSLATLTVFLILVSIVSCDKDKKSDNNPIGSTPKVIEDFPNAVGSYWVYETFDSINQVYDTITVTITDTITIPLTKDTAGNILSDAISTIWKYEPYIWGVGVRYQIINVVTTPDTVSFYSYFWGDHILEVGWLREYLLLPFDSGKTWVSIIEGELLYPETEVLNREGITTKAGTFDSTAHLEQMFNCGDECGGKYNFWFKEKVGIVYSHKFQLEYYPDPFNPITTLNATWELIDYHIE